MRVSLPLLGRLRQLMPKRLFPRALLIIILPLVLVQAMVAWFFYERHWKSVSAHMASGVVGEIMLVLDSMETAEKRQDRDWLAQAARDKLRLRVEFVGGAQLQNPVRGADIDPGDYSLKDRMFAQFIARSVTYPFVIDTGSEARRLGVSIQLPDGVLHVSTRDERLYSLTINILILSMISTSIVVLIIAVLFLRNQVRPIRWLASAAERYGKGQEAPDFRPSGAAEVRQAARNLLEMKNRMTRQIEQRSEMLAGVSHDLRAPLTRMKLQLAMLGEDPEIEDLRRDVDDMQRMVDGYLAYARGQDQEPAEPLDLAELLRAVADDTRRQGASVSDSVSGDMRMIGRPNGLKRCLTNLMENSRRHAESINLLAERRPNQIYIQIDDDGPGIPADRRAEMFRPFRRLDDARGPDTGGSGLGLTIARDVVRRHGGEIRLGASEMGGLRVELRLPV